MNKQEAIEKIYTASWDSPVYEGLVVKVETVNEIISQIHEPQKVVVPKFVAEWYERNKDNLNTAIYSTITGTYRKVNGENDDLLDTFEGWLVYEDNSILILIQMQLFGYKIKQKKLYTVEMPNPHATHNDVYILGRTLSGDISIWRINRDSDIKNYDSDFQLTEAEIKKDFEWAWQFAKEVE